MAGRDVDISMLDEDEIDRITSEYVRLRQIARWENLGLMVFPSTENEPAIVEKIKFWMKVRAEAPGVTYRDALEELDYMEFLGHVFEEFD